MKRLLTVSTMLALAACAQPKTWAQPGKTAFDFQNDKAACHIFALQGTPQVSAFGPPLMILAASIDNQRARQEVMDDCLTTHGWRAMP
jgi:hypothetical protein